MSTGPSLRVLRVLLVDDQPTVAAAVRKMLDTEADLELHFCSDPAKALETAIQLGPTVILQGLVMPGISGFALVDAYRLAPEVHDVPIIVLSANEDPRAKSKAFENGANDYLIKLPDKIELIARIRAHSRGFLLQRQRDEAYRELAAVKRQLEEQHSILARLSSLDGLTGIPNRRQFDEALDREWRSAQRRKVALSLILLDVDHFKKYNDHYGHQGGDDCLRQIASALRIGAQRPTDVAARYGGEEFAVLLPDTDPAGAAVVADHIRSRIAELQIVHAKSDTSTHVTVSIGIATLTPEPDSIAATIVARADANLYRAKERGRDRAVAD
jgi:two-component system chemotaxis family response regulator WspR